MTRSIFCQSSAEDALRYTFNTVGVALTITTVVLVAGFSVLSASSFSPSVTTGVLMAITLAFAWAVDFLFFAPLLLIVDRGTTSTGTPNPHIAPTRIRRDST
ncbi:MAG: hypothetical protein HOI95_26380 [Chromatiales bacterium]|jgi:uncharacterized protein|nr:hypothetical protein [Chromatiales bacterium]